MLIATHRKARGNDHRREHEAARGPEKEFRPNAVCDVILDADPVKQSTRNLAGEQPREIARTSMSFSDIK